MNISPPASLPYYILGSPKIKYPEDLKGGTLATRIPGTSADFAVRLQYTIGRRLQRYPSRWSAVLRRGLPR